MMIEMSCHELIWSLIVWIGEKGVHLLLSSNELVYLTSGQSGYELSFLPNSLIHLN